MLGRISRILEDKNYGFIYSSELDKYFFFCPALVDEESPRKYPELKVGNTVSFEPASKIVNEQEKGRATNVYYLA